jgi:2-polyprenyl-6-methoxyphenol hydroxylase-like FAD-dependent oxidoreductase
MFRQAVAQPAEYAMLGSMPVRGSSRRHRSVVVLGGGVAGLAAALALARDGHAVTLVERDALDCGEPLDAVRWDRKGIPHFLQAHAFTPRGRRELRETFPDVFEALIGAGAWDLDLRPRIRGGTPRADDADLAFLAIRRPLIEWALRRALLAERGIGVLAGTSATGLTATNGSDGPPTIDGVATTAGSIRADLVIDAMGRRSPAHAWVAAAGGTPMDERSTDCAIIYYTRYYRVHDGAGLAETLSIPGPRGDLGYGAFSTFPGDNGTFAALIAIPPGDQELKALRDVPAYDTATRMMPALHAWTNEDTSEPITDVLPMGSLRNTIRAAHDERLPAIGLISVGDSVCQSDPVASLGLAFALIHARLLAAVLHEHADLAEAARAFDALARPEMEERFGYLSAIDDTRRRLWAGESIDTTRRNGGAYAFFTYAATGIAAHADGDVFRAVVRRNMFLDPLAVLDRDPAMQARLEAFHADFRAAHPERPGPARDELIDAIRTGNRAPAGTLARTGASVE